MNMHDRGFAADAELAQIEYGDADFKIVRPGRYVVCAVSGVRIPLESLRYWNPLTQEAYAGPNEALARWKELYGRA